MLKGYSGVGSAAAGTDLTILTLISAATIRPALFEIIIGSVTAPADQATLLSIMRFTAVGTEGSGFTPVAHEPESPAALSDVGVGVFSVEPTYTASSDQLYIAVNQRNTFRWIAQEGAEIVAPRTASNGLGLRSKSSSATPAINATLRWKE